MGTTVSSVVRSSLVVPVVDQFREAVKAKYDQPNYLKDIPSGTLIVYKNKEAFDKRHAQEGKQEPLKSSLPLDGLGATDEEALIIAVPPSTNASNLSYVSVPEKLQQLGVQFNIRDINYLLNNEIAKYSFLKSPELTLAEAQSILGSARTKVKSETRKSIGLQHSFFLGSSLNSGQGQDKSSLYYAFSETGRIFVAKVYSGHKEDFTREVETNQALEHKNLVKFVKTFSIEENRHVIIMPFFPRSVADWLTHHPVLPLPAIRGIARNCFDALCHLHSKGYCFADLKPSNIMLHTAEPGVSTLVDYGAAVRIGSPIIEFTENYCLDAGTSIATERLDWICLGTTLAQMGGFEIYNYQRVADLVNDVVHSTQEDYFKNIVLSCLQNPSSSRIESALQLG